MRVLLAPAAYFCDRFPETLPGHILTPGLAASILPALLPRVTGAIGLPALDSLCSSCRSPGNSTRMGCWPPGWRTALSFPWMGAPSARRTWWRSLSCLWWTRPQLCLMSATPRCTELPLRAPSDRRARGRPASSAGALQWAHLKRRSLSARRADSLSN